MVVDRPHLLHTEEIDFGECERYAVAKQLEEPSVELSDLLRLLRVHWLVIGAAILLGIGLALGWSALQTPVYAAEAQGIVTVQVGAGSDTNAVYAEQIADSLAQSKMTSFLPIAQSRDVAQIVIDDLGLDTSANALASKVTVSAVTDSAVLTIRAESDTPQGAQDLADAWGRGIATRIVQIDTESGAAGIASVRVVQSAALPDSPVFPQPRLALALGALSGLLAGLGYAFIRRTLDRRIQTAETIERLFERPVVGTLPIDKRLSDEMRIIPEVDSSAHVGAEGKHALAEALRELRTNLQFMNIDHPPRVIVVTSPLPSDGKSTVTANLAVTLASSGQRVVVVDGDLRKPTVAKAFGVVPGVGLTDLLIGNAEVEDVLQPWGSSGNLWILGAGSIPPNPSELVGSQSMDALLRKLAEEAIVLIDAPPLLPVTDGAILTARTDGALVVISAGRTTIDELGKALQNLERVNGHTLGVILNRVPPRGQIGRGYGYYYANYYGAHNDAASNAVPLPQPGRRRDRARR